MDAELMYRVLAGELAVGQGAYDVGYGFMLKAAQSRQDSALFERTIQIAMQARAGASALSAAKAWQAQMPESRLAVQQTFGLELALQKGADAAKTLARLVKTLPAEDLEAFSAAMPAAISRLSSKEQRLQVVEQGLAALLKDPQRSAYAHAMVGNAQLLAQHLDDALRSARQALAQSPSNVIAGTLAVALMEQDVSGAQALAQRYVAQDAASARVRYFYARALAQQSQSDAALRELTRLTSDHPKEWEAWLLLATLQAERQQWEPAKGSAQVLLAGLQAINEQDSNALRLRNRAYLLLSEVSQKQGQYAQASQWLAQIHEPDDTFTVIYRRASLMAAQGQMAAARRLIADTPASDEGQERRRLALEVQLLREHDDWQAAYDLLAQGFARFPNETDWLYTQAMMAERLGQFDAMERLLRQHMALQPDDHQALNALGYSLADRGVRLVEARQLIEQALALAPNDPFVTDSLGWVQFRQGELEAAIATLQVAWRSRPDAEIAAHLGEALWQAGRVNDARKTWAQGLVTDPDNTTLRSTMKRLGAQL
jgi:tetratricopeptide (TPR) repeat protein